MVAAGGSEDLSLVNGLGLIILYRCHVDNLSGIVFHEVSGYKERSASFKDSLSTSIVFLSPRPPENKGLCLDDRVDR